MNRVAGGNEERGGQVASDGISPLLMAAHELKEPLALVRQLSLEAATVTDRALQQQLLTQIQLTAEKSLRLTTSLTKTDAAQLDLFPTRPVNVSQLLGDVSFELTPLYRQSGKTLRAKVPRRLPPAVANYDLLRRVMLGFADNALHYSGEDGAVHLFAQLRNRGTTVRLGVRDYGPALPRDILTNSAVRPQSVHARPDASGLGLRIAAIFAKNMNGAIGAIHHRDGASFYVDMPVSTQLSLL